MQRTTLDATIQLVSPLNISGGDQGRWDPTTSEWVYGDNKSKGPARGFPTARTKRTRIARAATEEGQRGDGSIPYLPGNGLRGGWRRAAADLVMRKLKERGESFNLELYHILNCGCASGQPDGATSVSATAEAAKHPFAGLFGGGSGFVWSSLSVGNGYPITPATLDSQVVPQTAASRSVQQGSLTGVEMSSRVDDILRGTGDIPSGLGNPEAEISAWLATLQASQDKKAKDLKAKAPRKAKTDEAKADETAGAPADEEEGKKVSIAHFYGTEYVAPGVQFFTRTFVDSELAGPAMLGLLAQAVCEWANGQRLGGCARKGWGRFRLELTATTTDGAAFQVLQLADGKYVVDRSSETMREAMIAFEKWMDGITIAEFKKAFLL